MGPVDVLCLGESMALFVPAESGPAAQVRTWHRTVGGAESNVACHLAGLGLRAAWVSVVGGDPFGSAITDFVARHGVDVSGVRVDPDRPTGVYFKSDGGVRYYRRGSAAAGMSPALLAGLPLDTVRLVHTSGITPVLSASCLDLMRALLGTPRRFLLSFDVNRRPALDQDPVLLRDLAALADVVLVGADEAAAVWGAHDPEAIREVLPEPPAIVVKQAEHGATLLERGEPAIFQPALRVDVVEPIGAGDAFAAGYLAALLAGEPPVRRLRAGHLRAASALRTRDDIGPPLPAALVESLLDAGAAEWAVVYIT